MLCHGRKNMDGQLVRVRVIYGDEFDAQLHQRRDESEITGQPIQFRNDQLGLELAAGVEGFNQFWPIAVFATFYLDEFCGHIPRPAI